MQRLDLLCFLVVCPHLPHCLLRFVVTILFPFVPFRLTKQPICLPHSSFLSMPTTLDNKCLSMHSTAFGAMFNCHKEDGSFKLIAH